MLTEAIERLIHVCVCVRICVCVCISVCISLSLSLCVCVREEKGPSAGAIWLQPSVCLRSSSFSCKARLPGRRSFHPPTESKATRAGQQPARPSGTQRESGRANNRDMSETPKETLKSALRAEKIKLWEPPHT